MAEFDEIEALRRQLAAARQREADLQARLDAAQAQGSGASAQDEAATAAGDRAALVQGDAAFVNTGTLHQNSGAVIEGAVLTHGGHFIGRDYIQYITQVVGSGEEEEAKSVIAHYLDALARDLSGLKLGEIDDATDRSKQKPLELADVYVPLETTSLIPKSLRIRSWLGYQRSERYSEYIESQGERKVLALEAAAYHRRLTLLGLPGSGKSTFGAYLLLHLAQTWQGLPDELAKQETTWTHNHLLPIRVVLRRFADQLPAGKGPARAGDLWDFIARDLKAAGYGLSDRVSDYIRRLARQSGALFLLDGLDECGDAHRRQRVLAAVEELIANTGEACRFVLTARPYAWPSGSNLERGVCTLADFDDGQVVRFIAAWYAALVRSNWLNPGEAEIKRDELLTARQRSDLAPLVKNPLLLTLTASLHTYSRLPEDRADLYDRSVDLLMQRWNVRIGADQALVNELDLPGLKLTDLRECLEELAFRVHEQHKGQQGAADISESRLIRAFKPLLGDSRDKAVVVVDYIEKRAGLLLGQGEKDGEPQFTFPHRTFQEFLAACHLAAREDFAAECAKLARAAPGHWQEVLPLAARIAKAERGASAADELIGGEGVADFRPGRYPKSEDWHCALLAGAQLLEIGPGALQHRPRTRAIAARVAGWLAAALPVNPNEGGLPALRRAEAGDLLAHLGDPRFQGPDCFHLPVDDDLGFVRIPADPSFRIGTRTRAKAKIKNQTMFEPDSYELNDKDTPTPEFRISRYLVTVAQFSAYALSELCKESDWRGSYNHHEPSTRPVRIISPRLAWGYCSWLQRRLQQTTELSYSEPARLIQAGWRVTLPSELEWEKAARGGLKSAIFPWGDKPDPEFANYQETEIGHTSSVGCFPANGYGLFDMAGNVYELTRSRWGERWDIPDFNYPYDFEDQNRENITDMGARHCLRGGSFRSHRTNVRCAARMMENNLFVPTDVGFRVALVHPIA